MNDGPAGVPDRFPEGTPDRFPDTIPGRGSDGTPAGALSGGLAARLSRLLPGLLIVFGIVFQLFTPPSLTGTPFFVSAPLMAAPLFSFWTTIAYGALSLGAATLMDVVAGSVVQSAGVQELVTELATIVFVTAIAALLNKVVQRGREQLASARSLAETAQRAVLPTPAERIDGLRLSTRYEAAEQEALIGGDLYGARSTPYGVRLLMGDVRGKGLGAIETVSVLLGAFWEAAHTERALAGVATRLEHALARESARRSGFDDTENFATCVLVEIPPGLRVLRIVNCGHPVPLLLSGDGAVDTLTPKAFSLPLGLAGLAPGRRRPDEWEFPPEATLLLYTDGLSEARDLSGDFYDPAARLKGRTFASPLRLLDALVGDVRRFSGGPATDDMALMAAYRPA
ncbi:PP2C family protein-serine/threonine phosphatase [Streptomyces sp. NPDC048290]|uniref:PP2C family protein-serine/threonine phosphatase n=1 Tax=Streptomyces sp. NPDC048290 TaxID=3155811 RepID=UPI00342EF620